jgi:hypothetical protein
MYCNLDSGRNPLRTSCLLEPAGVDPSAIAPSPAGAGLDASAGFFVREPAFDGKSGIITNKNTKPPAIMNTNQKRAHQIRNNLVVHHFSVHDGGGGV